MGLIDLILCGNTKGQGNNNEKIIMYNVNIFESVEGYISEKCNV